MAKTVLLLTKEDISCLVVGEHITIRLTDGNIINLDKEAAIELCGDLNNMLAEMDMEFE